MPSSRAFKDSRDGALSLPLNKNKNPTLVAFWHLYPAAPHAHTQRRWRFAEASPPTAHTRARVRLAPFIYSLTALHSRWGYNELNNELNSISLERRVASPSSRTTHPSAHQETRALWAALKLRRWSCRNTDTIIKKVGFLLIESVWCAPSRFRRRRRRALATWLAALRAGSVAHRAQYL
jgi:hypothetical protein